jgi:hypothetical protein
MRARAHKGQHVCYRELSPCGPAPPTYPFHPGSQAQTRGALLALHTPAPLHSPLQSTRSAPSAAGANACSAHGLAPPSAAAATATATTTPAAAARRTIGAPIEARRRS